MKQVEENKMVSWKFVMEIVGVALAIVAVVVCCIWMFKRIPNTSEKISELETEVERLEKKYKDGVPEEKAEGDGEEKKEQEEDEKPDPEQQLIQLFGSDLVQIIEEGGK
jgi:Tfp pilus assembly protein PilO